MNNRSHYTVQKATAIILGIFGASSLLFPFFWILFLLFLIPLGLMQLIGSLYYGMVKGHPYMKWHFWVSLIVLSLFFFGESLDFDYLFFGAIGLSIILAISYWVQTFKGIRYIKPHDVLDLE